MLPYKLIKGCFILKKLKLFLTVFLIVGLLSASATVILYADVISPEKTFTVYDYSYINYAEVWEYSSGLQARAAIESTSSLPSGYAGAYPRLYDDDGVLVLSASSWYYNDINTYGINSGTRTLYSVPGAYYSYGLTRAYNGNGYTQQTTYRSPSINY